LSVRWRCQLRSRCPEARMRHAGSKSRARSAHTPMLPPGLGTRPPGTRHTWRGAWSARRNRRRTCSVWSCLSVRRTRAASACTRRRLSGWSHSSMCPRGMAAGRTRRVGRSCHPCKRCTRSHHSDPGTRHWGTAHTWISARLQQTSRASVGLTTARPDPASAAYHDPRANPPQSARCRTAHLASHTGAWRCLVES
jgi:hypothetical protein